MPEPEEFDDGVVDYVLGEFDTRQRSEFDARLAASPELRAAVQKFEAACEALALTAPQAPPPARARKRLLRHLTVEECAAERIRFAWLRFPWKGVVVMASLMVLGWLAHDWIGTSATRDSRLMAQRSALPGPRGIRGENPEKDRRPVATGESSLPPGGRAPLSSEEHGTAGAKAPIDAARLRAWVQQLAGEVADLNRTLAQQAELPEGSARFQVFRLAGTNSPGPVGRLTAADPSFFGQQRVLEQWLANALVSQIGGLAPTPVEPGSALADSSARESGGSSYTATNTLTFASDETSSAFRMVDLSSSAPGHDVAPLSSAGVQPGTQESVSLLVGDTAGLGFYSSDTGRGSMAIIFGQTFAANQSLQFWALDDASGSTINLGTTLAEGASIFVRFAVDPKIVVNPAFMVTLEPLGGSVSPTGPIVVRPPPSVAPAP